MRLNESQEIPPKASGVTNSVASTRPKRSTTVSQMIEEISQCLAARSEKPSAPGWVARSVSGAGASAACVPPARGRSRSRVPSPPIGRDQKKERVSVGAGGRKCHLLVISRSSSLLGSAPREGNMRILVIEDEPRILAFL